MDIGVALNVGFTELPSLGVLEGSGEAHFFPNQIRGYGMKRFLLIICAPLAIAVAMAAPAYADSPHFIRASAALSGTSLNVSFKEAGLGTNQLITYVASASATATYVCVNHGGANPSASNKTTVNGPVSATGTFSSGKNGQVTAALTIAAPSAGSFTCPPGQRLEIAQVAYGDAQVSDITNGVTESVPGTFDSGCLLPTVRGAC